MLRFPCLSDLYSLLRCLLFSLSFSFLCFAVIFYFIFFPCFTIEVASDEGDHELVEISDEEAERITNHSFLDTDGEQVAF